MGSLRITVDSPAQLETVSQRVNCWAGADAQYVQVQMGASPALLIPEPLLTAHGSLTLKRGGTDLVAGYVAGTNIVAHAGNGLAMSQDPGTCAADTNQPTITATGIVIQASPAFTIQLNYANVVAAGTVDITWGDGTSDLAQAESGAILHTYPGGHDWRIRIADASVPTDWAETIVHIPDVR